jgi:hypothetical protein
MLKKLFSQSLIGGFKLKLAREWKWRSWRPLTASLTLHSAHVVPFERQGCQAVMMGAILSNDRAYYI